MVWRRAIGFSVSEDGSESFVVKLRFYWLVGDQRHLSIAPAEPLQLAICLTVVSSDQILDFLG